MQGSAVECPSICECPKDNVAKCNDISDFSWDLLERIPESTTHLQLKNNGIKEITAKSFESLENLVYLDLEGNNIGKVYPQSNLENYYGNHLI